MCHFVCVYWLHIVRGCEHEHASLSTSSDCWGYFVSAEQGCWMDESSDELQMEGNMAESSLLEDLGDCQFPPSLIYFYLLGGVGDWPAVCLHQSPLQLSPATSVCASLLNAVCRRNVSTAFTGTGIVWLCLFDQAFRCINTPTGSTRHAFRGKISTSFYY